MWQHWIQYQVPVQPATTYQLDETCQELSPNRTRTGQCRVAKASEIGFYIMFTLSHDDATAQLLLS